MNDAFSNACRLNSNRQLGKMLTPNLKGFSSLIRARSLCTKPVESHSVCLQSYFGWRKTFSGKMLLTLCRPKLPRVKSWVPARANIEYLGSSSLLNKPPSFWYDKKQWAADSRNVELRTVREQKIIRLVRISVRTSDFEESGFEVLNNV